MNTSLKRVLITLTAIFLIANIQGCATVANPDRRDPLESFNRGVFQFNDAVDAAVVKPAAIAYKDVTPSWLRKGVGNFFSNLADFWSGINNALQLRGMETADSFGRFAINSTMGLGGILDVASEMRLERHPANFGLTLGRWGVGDGPFLVLPLLGPSTTRDAAALSIDIGGNPVRYHPDINVRNGLSALNLLDTRARLLSAGEVVEDAALDKYSFMRDAYLQRRRNQVYDGNPPEEDEAPDPSATPATVPPNSEKP